MRRTWATLDPVDQLSLDVRPEREVASYGQQAMVEWQIVLSANTGSSATYEWGLTGLRGPPRRDEKSQRSGTGQSSTGKSGCRNASAGA